MQIERGFRGKLDDFLDVTKSLSVKLTATGNAVYDSCCFGVDINEKLSDERYMIFYNQTNSPSGEITYRGQGNEHIYDLDLTALPGEIVKLVFTLSIDGEGTMGEISSAKIEIMQSGNSVIELALSGKDFKTEKAIIGLEIYNKTVWRTNVIARGFDGGLDALLMNYGGELADEQPASNVQQQPHSQPAQPVAEQIPQQVSPEPVATPAQSAPISLEKKLTDKMMGKISLSKDKVNLEKHVVSLSKCAAGLSVKNGVDLGGLVARVVVALDYSGSMRHMYKSGVVQQTINKLLPLGLAFDDNGSVDVFLFQSDYCRMPSLDISNYETFVNNVIMTSGYRMGGTNYAPVLEAIVEGERGGFLGRKIVSEPIVNDYCPTFILFMTDGSNADPGDTSAIIKSSSEKNVFIQFIGIGNDEFKYLRKLDDLRGRARDNTGFSSMKDLVSVTDDELYANVLGQFSEWLMGLR